MTDERIKRYQTAIQAYNVQMYVIDEMYKGGAIDLATFKSHSENMYYSLSAMIKDLQRGGDNCR